MNRFALIIVFMGAALCGGCSGESAPDGTIPIAINGEVFHMRPATDFEARKKGLGGVDSLGPQEGMIFIFPDSRVRSFWMDGCTIDLDIAYLDPLGIITSIHTMPAEPLRGPQESREAYEARLARYSSINPAQFAIELQAGRMAQLGLQPHQKLELDLNSLKALAE